MSFITRIFFTFLWSHSEQTLDSRAVGWISTILQVVEWKSLVYCKTGWRYAESGILSFSGAQGAGIYLINSPDQLKNTIDRSLIQEYVSDPFLLPDQLKFDFRVYAVIKSLNPLSIYVAREGKAPSFSFVHFQAWQDSVRKSMRNQRERISKTFLPIWLIILWIRPTTPMCIATHSETNWKGRKGFCRPYSIKWKHAAWGPEDCGMRSSWLLWKPL